MERKLRTYSYSLFNIEANIDLVFCDCTKIFEIILDCGCYFLIQIRENKRNIFSEIKRDVSIFDIISLCKKHSKDDLQKLIEEVIND